MSDNTNLADLCGLHGSSEIEGGADFVPECAGVYMFFGNWSELTADIEPDEPPLRVGIWDLLYVGSADNLRRRIECHLRDDSRSSSFRVSIGALLRVRLALRVNRRRPLTGAYYFSEGEERLTEWLKENTAFAFWPFSHHREMEKALIGTLPCLLNISDRRSVRYARQLMALRAVLGERSYERRRPMNRVSRRAVASRVVTPPQDHLEAHEGES